MRYCSKCGEGLLEGAGYCPKCGASAGAAGAQWQDKAREYAGKGAQALGTFMDTQDDTGRYDTTDIERNKWMALLSYLGFLVFVPIFGARDSQYARYHANQGLLLFLAETAWWVATRVAVGVLSIAHRGLGSFVGSIMDLANIIFLVFVVIGVINVLMSKARELPIIGGFRILR